MIWRDALLFLHIVGAGTWLGANVVQMVAPPIAFAQGDQAAAGWMRIGGNLGRRLYMPAGIVVLLTGILLVIQSPVFGFADRFVTVGFAMIIFGNVLGPVVFTPGAEKTAQALEAGDRDMATALLGRIGRFGALDTVLLLLTFWVMIIRWN